MSRVLLTAPEAASGTRLWKAPSAGADPAMEAYDARLMEILELTLPLASRTRNQLLPRTLPLSAAARQHWIDFHDDVERRLGPGGELEPVALANKLPEHAARIAAVLTLVGGIKSTEVGSVEMEAGIEFAGCSPPRPCAFWARAASARTARGAVVVVVVAHQMARAARLPARILPAWPELDPGQKTGRACRREVGGPRLASARSPWGSRRHFPARGVADRQAATARCSRR